MKTSSVLLSLMILLGTGTAFSQSGSAKQVTWIFSSKKITEKKYEVSITATIAGDYHLYAQDGGVEGPIPTKISFLPNPLLTLEGKTIERGKKISKVESVWGGKVNFYNKTVTFVQIVGAKTKAKTMLNGNIEFMVCNDDLCLPPSEVTFKIAIGQ